jgi:hypothetical protein
MAPYSSLDDNAKCTAFVTALSEAPYGLDVRKRFGPFASAAEAELGLQKAGWIMKIRFNSGGSQWVAVSGC